MSKTDEALLKQYTQGDYAAFEKLYLKHKGPLYRYLLRQLHNSGLVDDIFQEVWSKVVSHAESFENNATFKTWLYTIARNKVIDHVRHVKVVEQVIQSNYSGDVLNNLELSEDQTIELASSNKESPDMLHKQLMHAQAIDHCLHQLPKHLLDSFLLREEAGFTAKNIAQVMSISLEAAKSRLKVGYKNLRTCLSLKLDLGDPQASKFAGEIHDE